MFPVDYFPQRYFPPEYFPTVGADAVVVPPPVVTILPQEKFENVKRSIFKYMQENFTTSTLDFEGSEAFDSRSVDDWVWVGISNKTYTFMRHVNFGHLGDIVNFTLHCMIYCKPTEDIMRVDRIADTLRSLLRRASIPIYDFDGDGSVIGQAIGNGVIADRPVHITIPGSAEEDIRMHAIDFQYQFLMEYVG